jgi:hypothetical protein
VRELVPADKIIMIKSKLNKIHGQPSWKLASDKVELYVTREAGMLGPATFSLKNGDCAPYSVAPWAVNSERIDKELPPLLHALRGDFFCLPFGGNDTAYRGEQHPPHGETANAMWSHVETTSEEDEHQLHLQLDLETREGTVDKFVTLRDGHHAIYQKHVVTGMSGPMTPGHHAMLKLPDVAGCGRVSTSAFAHAQVLPFPFENPEIGGYSTLKPDEPFKSLKKVALNTGNFTDLTTYPARKGFDDLVMMVAKPTLKLGWTAVTFPKERIVYFALKDPRVLRNTILWMSNGGRHYHPWNGRHTGVLGIEDVTSYFHIGLAESVKKNPLSTKGFPTSVTLNANQPYTVNYIMGMTDIPAGFDKVKTIKSAGTNKLELVSDSGKKAKATVDTDYLYQSD